MCEEDCDVYKETMSYKGYEEILADKAAGGDLTKHLNEAKLVRASRAEKTYLSESVTVAVSGSVKTELRCTGITAAEWPVAFNKVFRVRETRHLPTTMAPSLLDPGVMEKFFLL